VVASNSITFKSNFIKIQTVVLNLRYADGQAEIISPVCLLCTSCEEQLIGKANEEVISMTYHNIGTQWPHYETLS
jgi:hypothetical protein